LPQLRVLVVLLLLVVVLSVRVSSLRLSTTVVDSVPLLPPL
jgi:hypothetical protein